MDNATRVPDGPVQLLSEYTTPLNREGVLASSDSNTDLDKLMSNIYIKIRPTKCIKGSAYMEVGNTKVSANISPPTNIKKHYGILRPGQIRVSTRYTPYASKYNTNISRSECLISREVKSALQTILLCTEYQNVVFDVNILVIEDDGCVLASAINCSIMALVQAKISAYEIAAASTIMLYKDKYYCNPNAELEATILNAETKEESPCYAIMTCTTLGTCQQIGQLLVIGFTEMKQFNHMLETCLMMNEKFLPKMTFALERYLRQALKVEPIIKNYLESDDEEKNSDKKLAAANNDLNNVYEKNDLIDADEEIIESSSKEIIEVFSSDSD